MNREMVRKMRIKDLSIIFLLVLGYCLSSCVTYQPSTIVIKRAGTYMDDGKLYIYVDGKQLNKNQPIGKGQTRNLSISNGVHKIWITVNNLESDRIQFTVENNTVSFSASTERIGGSKVLLLERIE
jgi:hypothetical protein